MGGKEEEMKLGHCISLIGVGYFAAGVGFVFLETLFPAFIMISVSGCALFAYGFHRVNQFDLKAEPKQTKGGQKTPSKVRGKRHE